MSAQYHIPERLKIGFNKRDDTFSGLLGFITYNLKDGTTKHKRSWDNWIDKDIKVQDIPNEPTEGFVLNKREGGGGRWSFNEREPKIRVWDPRNFEIEVTIENMLDILSQCGSYPGKGLEGKFVYGFSGNRLQLINVKSEDYKNSAEFTDLSKMSVDAKDLIIGATYISKDQKTLVYLGRLPWIDTLSYRTNAKVSKEHIFFESNRKKPDFRDLGYDREDEMDETDLETEFEAELESFKPWKIANLAKCLDSNPVSNLADLMTRMENTGLAFNKDMVSIKGKKIQLKTYFEEQYVDSSSRPIYETGATRRWDPEFYWVKKDENTYEGFNLQLEFDALKLKEDRYRYGRTLAKSLKIVYKKKLIITDEGVEVKTCSKKDDKSYLPKDLEVMEVYDIKLNLTKYITSNYMSDIAKGYKRSKSDLKKESLKDLA